MDKKQENQCTKYVLNVVSEAPVGASWHRTQPTRTRSRKQRPRPQPIGLGLVRFLYAFTQSRPFFFFLRNNGMYFFHNQNKNYFVLRARGREPSLGFSPRLGGWGCCHHRLQGAAGTTTWHGPRLETPARSYLVGVPVAVEDDHSVGRLEVEAEPAGARAEQEDEVLGARLIEGLQQHAPVLRLRGACQCGGQVQQGHQEGAGGLGWQADSFGEQGQRSHGSHRGHLSHGHTRSTRSHELP